MNPNTKTLPPHAGPALAIIRAAIERLNACRRKCPGVGGDIDSANLNWLMENPHIVLSSTSAVMQAANTLERLSTALEIDATAEVEGLRAIPMVLAAPDMLEALRALVDEADLAEVDMEPEDAAKLDAARAVIVKAEGRT